jgi:hypothetical protein
MAQKAKLELVIMRDGVEIHRQEFAPLARVEKSKNLNYNASGKATVAGNRMQLSCNLTWIGSGEDAAIQAWFDKRQGITAAAPAALTEDM